MIGQSFRNVTEVMVLVKLDDGTEHGWVVNRPAYVEWIHRGLTASGSARGAIEIGVGEFYRRSVGVKLNWPALEQGGDA